MQVPVPTGYGWCDDTIDTGLIYFISENMDPTMDQDPPTMKVTLKHVYSEFH